MILTFKPPQFPFNGRPQTKRKRPKPWTKTDLASLRLLVKFAKHIKIRRIALIVEHPYSSTVSKILKLKAKDNKRKGE